MKRLKWVFTYIAFTALFLVGMFFVASGIHKIIEDHKKDIVDQVVERLQSKP